MPWQRLGLVPNTDHDDAQHLHRAAVVISRDPSNLTKGKYGRAVLGTLDQPDGFARLASVGAVVHWGSDSAAVAKSMLRNQAALMVLVFKTKPKRASEVLATAKRLAARGVVIEVYTIGAKMKMVRAIDVGEGTVVKPVANLRHPPQQQSAPSTPRKEAKPAAPVMAPSTPRPEPKG